MAAGVCAQDAAETLLHVAPLGAERCCAHGVQGVPTGLRACTPAPWGGAGSPRQQGCSAWDMGWRGHGRDTGAGMQGAAPRGCLCLAAAEFDSWYSPPFSGVTLGSALRMRRPKRRKIPGFMLLLGMLCMSGAELGLGLKSVSGRLKWQGS